MVVLRNVTVRLELTRKVQGGGGGVISLMRKATQRGKQHFNAIKNSIHMLNFDYFRSDIYNLLKVNSN